LIVACARRCIQRLARPAARGGQRDGPRVHALGSVLRQPAVDGDLFADLERFAAPARALQAMRRTHLGAPVGDLSGLIVLDVDIEPHVRIRPFELGDDSRQRDFLVSVELRRKGMMRRRPSSGQQHADDDQAAKDVRSHLVPPSTKVAEPYGLFS
jgi:hypothetical protein